MISRLNFYSREELVRIGELRKQGITWERISQITGRPINSLKVQHSRFKNGHLDARLARREAIIARDRTIEILAENGNTVQEIAEKVQFGYHRAYQRLKWLGFDAEVLAEYRTGAV